MEEFLAMGGYAKYVWGSYGVSLIVLLTTVWLTKQQFRATYRQVSRQVNSMQGKSS